MLNNTETLASALATSLLNNSTNKSCSEGFSKLRCYVAEFDHTFAYLLLAFALIPQIIHLFHYRNRYIAGISYLWIIIRVLALTSLMLARGFRWASILELAAFISTIIIFLQIIIFSNNLHRQNKIILIVMALLIWTIGKILIFFFVEQERSLTTISYVLLAIQMLPQILLNSLLRTAKALSKISIILLAMSDLLLFLGFPINRTPPIYLISIYYSFSFFLYICFQNLVYSDAHIHLISRSEHTVLTPGVDIFTGLDVDGKKSSGNDPQMFAVEDLEPMNVLDVIYQPLTTNKSSQLTPDQTPAQLFVWYAISTCIFCIETFITIMLIYRIGSPWIIFVPLSILLILGIFYLLRTRLGTLETETLRKIL